jgi:hypothetical protein
MNELQELENDLPRAMRQATAHVVADATVQRRLIDAATAQPQRRSTGRERTSRSHRISWLLPSVAALISLLVAGSVLITRDRPAKQTVVPAVRGLAACSAPDHGAYSPPTKKIFVDHILGTWLVCSHPSLFGTADAGLQINADGRWTKLLRNSAGQLVAATTSGNQGSWRTIDAGAMNGRPTFQLNLHIDGSGTVVTVPTFSKGVARVHLDNNEVYAADYVQTSERVVPAGPANPGPSDQSSGPGHGPPLAACTTPDSGAYVPTTAQDFIHYIVGTWLVCSHPSIFRTTEAGMQIGSDGHWAKLYRDPNGGLVAGTGSRDEGTWREIDVSAENGGPTFQLNLKIEGSGTVITLPTMSKGVTRMDLDDGMGNSADYVPTSEKVVRN